MRDGGNESHIVNIFDDKQQRQQQQRKKERKKNW